MNQPFVFLFKELFLSSCMTRIHCFSDGWVCIVLGAVHTQKKTLPRAHIHPTTVFQDSNRFLGGRCGQRVELLARGGTVGMCWAWDLFSSVWKFYSKHFPPGVFLSLLNIVIPTMKWCELWGCHMHRQASHFMILAGPFPLRKFYDTRNICDPLISDPDTDPVQLRDTNLFLYRLKVLRCWSQTAVALWPFSQN